MIIYITPWEDLGRFLLKFYANGNVPPVDNIKTIICFQHINVISVPK